MGFCRPVVVVQDRIGLQTLEQGLNVRRDLELFACADDVSQGEGGQALVPGIGIGLPASTASRGFGSKLSTWETPPDMKQKMTLLIFGAKCGLPSGGAHFAPAP